MQAVIRALLSLETETFLFVDSDQEDDVVITVHGPSSVPFDDTSSMASDADITTKVVSEMAAPTREVISSMTEGLLRCQAVLMDLSGYRRYLGPAAQVSSDIGPIQIRLRQAKAAFDMVESRLLESGDLPPSTLRDSHVVQLFVFARHVRETAATIENLMAKIESMQHLSEWPRLYLPSYPLRKALHRSNAQVRHDRGGAAATSYDMTFIGIVRLLDKLKSREHHPLNQNDPGDEGMGLRAEVSHATMDAKVDGFSPPKETFRHKLWHTLHRLQGFESRYAFKVCLVTTLLSVPGYMEVNSSWWDKYEVWWAVTMSWIAMHPRIGGNLQDLVIRASLAILGAAWSGAAYAAGNGNPYVMAVFAAIYMIPMLYRYTQSTHPVCVLTLHTIKAYCSALRARWMPVIYRHLSRASGQWRRQRYVPGLACRAQGHRVRCRHDRPYTCKLGPVAVCGAARAPVCIVVYALFHERHLSRYVG